MSFCEYQPEEYEQFFLSKQEKIVEEALSTPISRLENMS